LVLASAAVSAVWRSLIAVVTVAKVDVGVGKAGLPLIASMMPGACVTSAGALAGERFSDAIDLRIVFVVAAMRSYPFVE
jgi:hypothetical protein